MKKLESGIHNFDRLLGGGIPQNALVLVEGPPGTGKSNMGLEFLYRGAQRGQNGLYVALQDTEEEILRATTFDWEFEEAVESGRIKITTFDPYRYEQLANMLRSMIKENDAERVVLDPITDLDIYIDNKKDRRKNLMELKKEMKNLDSTGMIVAEKNETTDLEEEVADVIAELDTVEKGGRLEKRIRILKVRGSDYNKEVHSYKLENDGLKIQ